MNPSKKEKENLNIDTNIISKPVNEVLSSLDIEWKTVITLRYGLNGQQPKSLEEVAEVLGTSVEAIRSLENNALRYFYTKRS